MCLYPRFFKNKKYLPNKKNGYNPPKPKDWRTLYVPVKCGECEECRKALAREWTIRLEEELKENKGWYITMTFSEESLIKLDETTEEGHEYRDNEIATKAMRLFLERWRKKYTKSMKHMFITELGHEGTERIHLHGIIFTEDENKIAQLKKIWKYGWVSIGEYCNGKTIGYITKYITKTDLDHPLFKGKILASDGIGKGYLKREKTLNQYRGKETKEYYLHDNGSKSSLPIYYRNHIYTEEQREKLWINKLDEGTRYITGTKYDFKTKEDIANFYNALKIAQKDNKKHGYKEIKWELKDYKIDIEKLNNYENFIKNWENDQV